MFSKKKSNAPEENNSLKSEADRIKIPLHGAVDYFNEFIASEGFFVLWLCVLSDFESHGTLLL